MDDDGSTGTPQRHDAATTAAAMLRASMAGPRPNTRRPLYTHTYRQLLHVALNTTSQARTGDESV